MGSLITSTQCTSRVPDSAAAFDLLQKRNLARPDSNETACLGLPNPEARFTQVDSQLHLHVTGSFVCHGVKGLVQVRQ